MESVLTQQTEPYAELRISVMSKHLSPLQKEKVTQAAEQYRLKTQEAAKKFKRRVEKILEKGESNG